MCHNRRMGPRWIAWLWPVLIAAGCGGDDPENWDPGRPRVDAVRFVGQDPQSPLGLQFALTFVDTDGDLGGGELQLDVGGTSAGGLALAELFAAQNPALPLESTQGELEVLVRLNDSPQTGDQVEFGFVLRDAAGQSSNRPTVTLEAVVMQTGSLSFTDAPGGGG